MALSATAEATNGKPAAGGKRHGSEQRHSVQQQYTHEVVLRTRAPERKSRERRGEGTVKADVT